ncbi:MAG: 4-hydroxy-tetrahydrodipicolinate synthase [Bacteroidales bacterium]
MNGSIFTGTGVALVTPFDTHGELDLPSLKNTVKHVLKGKVDYLVALGTTAETSTLSDDEKNIVVKTILETAGGKVPVVMGVGGNNTEALVKKIQTTDFTGIDAILSVAPWYNKPTQDGIYLHFAKVAEASPVPVILYNVPGRTSSNISARTCIRLAYDFEGKIAGVKEASGNFSQIMEIIANKPDVFHVISGEDALTYPMITLGGSGVISVIANAYPEEYSSMVRYALSGELEQARKIHYPLLPLIDAMFEEGNPAGVKAFMKLKGILDDNLRLPLVKVSSHLREKIHVLSDELNI